MHNHGLLIVSFGTSYHDALHRDIIPTEQAISAAFPNCKLFRAFGSEMIIRKIAKRDNLHIDTISDALKKMYEEGITDVLVQPTYLIHGIEYDLLMDALKKSCNYFASISIGKPLLNATEDFLTLTHNIAASYPEEVGALVLMGHGTEHYANAAYPALETVFRKEGYDHVFVGAVEGYPDVDMICREVSQKGITHITLMPLMLVAGDHAVNDMASDEPDSWKSKLEASGAAVRCILRGLGSYTFIQQMFIKHAREAKTL